MRRARPAAVRRGAVALLAAGAVAAAAGVGTAAAPADDEPWLRALVIRSTALNATYGLGEYAGDPAERALLLRSAAMNRLHIDRRGERAGGSARP